MKIVAFLPAKGSSSRIESKNIKLLAGKPLFLHTLDKLLRIKEINEVYLDTESKEVIDLAGNFRNHKVLLRDPNLANNKTDGNTLFFNEVKHVDADLYIQILGTSPFIKTETIIKGIQILRENKDFDSVVLVRKEKRYEWSDKGPKYDINNIPNSFDLNDSIFETMGLYIVRKESVENFKRRIGKKPYLLYADSEEFIDINYPEDFELANTIMLGNLVKEHKHLNLLKTFFTSALLSDILDDLDVKSFIHGLIPNQNNHKLFGRVKTLNLKPIQNENYTDIYKALDTYNAIEFNDIILVNNPIENNAYFGNLNANLAVRAGAQATIVLGYTRDSKEVINMQYPVFSFGNNSQDVKRRGVFLDFNNPISYKGLTIFPHDLIFADSEGMVIIPKKFESFVISRAIEIITKEKNITDSILNGFKPNEIFKKFGEF
jgi:CMP-N-acetylneuraminic acid synthetase/regulator of RNase E activity RraA